MAECHVSVNSRETGWTVDVFSGNDDTFPCIGVMLFFPFFCSLFICTQWAIISKITIFCA